PFEVLKQVLTHLSPPDMSPLEPDEPMRLPGDARDIPTLKHPYGRVSLLHVSAGVRRIVSLAYLMVWRWEEHKAFSKLAYHQPLQNMVVLIDEIEAHLHPQWQRSILPALLKVREALAPNLHIQFLAATHSPLVLASMEPVFEEQKDKLFHLALKEGKAIQLEEMPFPRCGRVDSWLMSDVFQLRHARSIEAEKAIEDAKKIQLEEKVTVKQVKEVSARLVKYLAPDDRFWPRWTFFAEEKGVRI
ncbi:MAG: ATP-binding protein, partial [bacterium]|nr:ATP-binding protein [bacterium]